ncbi:MAG: MFS transporter [Chlamydiota bacterium]
MAQSSRSYCGWVIFALNLLLVVYLSAPGLVPLAFSKKMLAYFNTSSSTLTYAMTCYFYSFGIFLIPVGLLIDRYPSQWIISLGTLIAGLGHVLLIQNSHLINMIIARGLIGLGATVGLSYAVKCLSDWFSPKKFALLLSIFISLKLFLMIALGSILTQFLQFIAWKKIIFSYGLCSIPLAFLIIFTKHIAKKEPSFSASTNNIPWNQAIRQLFDSSQIWFIGATTGFFFGVLLVFVSKWSIPFFQTAYAISAAKTSHFMIIFALGYFCGSIFFSYMSTSLRKRKMFVPWGILTSALMLIIIIYPPYLPINSIIMISFLFGFAGAAGLLGYVIIHEQNIPELTATAIASINVFFALAIAFTDPLVDSFLQIEQIAKGTSTYSLSEFQISLFRIPLYVLFSFFFSLFIRETRAKQRIYRGNN